MTSADLTSAILQRLKKYSLVILVAAILGGALLFMYAKTKPVTYTSTSTLFSLTSGNDATSTPSALSAILGTETNKSFSEEASINIIELAQSRTTREEVAAIKLPSMGNKTIAALLIEDYNRHRGWLESEIKLPREEYQLPVLFLHT